MSLDSKYNWINEFTNLLTKFKNLKPKKPERQLKKEQIMKNVDELYEQYYNGYKSDYDNDDELREGKKKKFDYRQFGWFVKTDKRSKLDEETENFLKEI